MTVSFTDLYNRLGGHFGIAKAQVDARSAILTRAQNLDGQYTSATRYMFTPILNQFLSIYNSTDATISNAVAGARKTLVEMVNADNPSISKQVLPAKTELNRQMRAGSTSLLQNTITQGAVARTGTGNGTVLLHGTPSQMSRSETLYFTCISDTTTGAVAGSEAFSVTSTAAYPSIGDYRWPGGTGLSTTMVSSDYGSAPNLLTNGTFDNWTAGLPDNWTSTNGVSQLTSGAYRSPTALRFTNTGNVISISQGLSATAIGPGKRLVFGCHLKKISGTAAQDVEVTLQTDSGSSYATLTISAAQINAATSWTRFTSSFQHSWSAPQETANFGVLQNGDAGVSIAIDCVFVFAPIQAGTNGQFVQIIAGDTNWRIGDYMTVTITNNYASNVLGYTERFFAPFANGIELPTAAAGAGTIDNSVIP